MKKILAPSLVIATILVGVVMVYALWNASPVSSEEFFESGRDYYESEQYPQAIIQLLNAIQRDGANRDARYYLALSHGRQGDAASAVRELRALLEYFPEDVEATLQLGNIYLTGGRGDPEFFREASALAGGILEREPDNVGALVLSGNASAGLQDYRASVEQFEKAISLDPENSSAYVSLGTSQALQTNYPEAEQAFVRAREIDPENPSVLMSLGNYYRAVGRPDEAEATFEGALDLHPSNPQVYLQVVEFYYQAGRFDDVERVLRDAAAETGGDPAPLLVLADLYPAQGRNTQARELLLELKERFPENLDIASRLAVQALADDRELARAEIDRILEAQPESPVGHILLGELQFLGGETEAAEATFARDQAANSPYPQPHFFLGQISASRGRFDQAADQYRQALALNAGYLPARVALAEVLLRAGQIAEARAEINAILQAQPDSPAGRLLKAALDRTEGNSSDAAQALAALVSEQPDNPLVHEQMALLDESEGRPGAAERSWARVLELQPDSIEALGRVVQFHVRQGQLDRALETIDAVPDPEKTSVHYELKGRVYMEAGRLDEAEAAFQRALDLDPASAARSYLTAQYVQAGRLDEALGQLEAMAAADPLNASVHGARGMVYEGQGQLSEAKQSYRQALAIDPQLASAANNLAYILAEEGEDLDTALQWGQVARRNLPDNPSAADTLGWVYYKRGNYILARDQLEFAVSRQPGNRVFQYHLGMIYIRTGQLPAARQALNRAIAGPDALTERSLAEAALAEIGNE